MSVQDAIPFLHAAFCCFYPVGSDFTPAHRALLHLVEAIFADAIVRMLIFAVSPCVKNVEIIETYQAMNRMLVNFNALFGPQFSLGCHDISVNIFVCLDHVGDLSI